MRARSHARNRCICLRLAAEATSVTNGSTGNAEPATFRSQRFALKVCWHTLFTRYVGFCLRETSTVTAHSSEALKLSKVSERSSAEQKNNMNSKRLPHVE